MRPVVTEPIERPFGLRTRVDPGNHVLDEGQDPHRKGRPTPIVKYRNTAVICAKTAELIEMLFGFWSWMG